MYSALLQRLLDQQTRACCAAASGRHFHGSCTTSCPAGRAALLAHGAWCTPAMRRSALGESECGPLLHNVSLMALSAVRERLHQTRPAGHRHLLVTPACAASSQIWADCATAVHGHRCVALQIQLMLSLQVSAALLAGFHTLLLAGPAPSAAACGQGVGARDGESLPACSRAGLLHGGTVCCTHGQLGSAAQASACLRECLCTQQPCHSALWEYCCATLVCYI